MTPVSRLAVIGVNSCPVINDLAMLIVLHACLVAVLVTAMFGTVRARWRLTRGAVPATVTRGERSMTVLYVAYAVATVSLSLAVDVAQAAAGYKVAIIAFDYVVLSYLFFFNSWFRNRLLGLLGSVYDD